MFDNTTRFLEAVAQPSSKWLKMKSFTIKSPLALSLANSVSQKQTNNFKPRNKSFVNGETINYCHWWWWIRTHQKGNNVIYWKHGVVRLLKAFKTCCLGNSWTNLMLWTYAFSENYWWLVLRFLLQLAGHKNLVEQCVQGCGTVQVNLQLKVENDGTKKINIIDVLKPSDSYLLASGNMG